MSQEIANLFTGLFTETTFMGVSYTIIKGKTDSTRDVTSIYNMILPSVLEPLRAATQRWKEEINRYTPSIPTNITNTRSSELFVNTSFNELLQGRSSSKVVVFQVSNIGQLKAMLKRMKHGFYLKRHLYTAINPQDRLIISRVKAGLATDIYDRALSASTASSVDQEYIFFHFGNKALAETVEKLIKYELEFQKRKGECFNVLASQVQQIINDCYDLVEGTNGGGRLTGLTKHNWTSKSLDLADKEESCTRYDEVNRTTLPDNMDSYNVPIIPSYNTGLNLYNNGLDSDDWKKIVYVIMTCFNVEKTPTELNLIQTLQTDMRLHLNANRTASFFNDWYKRWAAKLGIDNQRFMTSKNPARFLCDIYGFDVNNLPLHWYYKISNRYELYSVRKYDTSLRLSCGK